MAWKVAFISQKGGVGKSTAARALAREATVGGIKTKIADLDLASQLHGSQDCQLRILPRALPPTQNLQYIP